ncbi:membrane protein insertase YidC [Streptomyces sp. HNM0575]|uniref:YidC/Oxa1 family membrane protein insertase n=1 Tax=Streptomyces sp. HNM0575 TaxID=2716338 RepID=UPI00145CCDB4|nr:membrane protein insertase YidC [Streptomyces sp. HNM0575]NLU71222.1 membrane protein insertase YidC [Streptomyces sp. HNM0575]
MSFFAAFVERFSALLAPFFGASATAAAIVACTLCVRLALHPLARAAVRGERVRARLAPRIAELKRDHDGDQEGLRRELERLQEREGASPVAGCLPMLLQLPVFFAMYHLFTTDEALLGHTLLGAPLGGRLWDAVEAGGVLGGPCLVYAGLFVLVAAVATWTYVRTRRLMAARAAAPAATATAAATAGAAPASVPVTAAGRTLTSGAPAPGGAVARALPLLSFGTLITVAVVPLAAALYVVTTTTWTAVERAALGAGRVETVPGAGAAPSARRVRRSTT